MNPTALGSGPRMLNAYSLVNSKTVYEGQRAAAPDQRVFILTRSAFAGQQHYGASVWSGDITSTWTALRAQIPAGLGLAVSGIPYWSMDIGGFSVPARFAAAHPTADDAEEWRELNDALVPVRHLRSAPARARRGAQARDVGVRRRIEPGLQGAS